MNDMQEMPQNKFVSYITSGNNASSGTMSHYSCLQIWCKNNQNSVECIIPKFIYRMLIFRRILTLLIALLIGCVASCNQSKQNLSAPVTKHIDTASNRIVSFPTPKIDSILWRKHWIDSLKRRIVSGYKTSESSAGIRCKNAYLNSCWLLGYYYTRQYLSGKERNMRLARQYFNKFINLTYGPDSDLGDNNSINTMMLLSKRVARFYETGLLDVKTLHSLYVGHFINPKRINMHNQFIASVFDTGTLPIRFLPGNRSITTDTRLVLNQIAQKMISDTSRRVYVAGGFCNSEFEQEISWEQANAVIEYLTGRKAIKHERFIMSYCGKAEIGTVTIRWSKPGEYGPSIVAPPHPFLLEGW